MLHATRISVRRGDQVCLNDVSFSMLTSELVALVGACGSGKTTLLDVCAGLVRPDCGHVWVGGYKDGVWPAQSPHVRRAYVQAQEHWQMAVCAEDAVMMGGWQQRLPGREKVRRARLCLEAVGAACLQRRLMPTLSPAQQLRVCLARLLMQMWELAPDGRSYLFIDAAVGAADDVTQRLVFDLAHVLAKRGAAVALASHDYTRILDTADRVVMLKEGAVVADGCPHTVLTAGRLAIGLDVDATVERSAQTQRLAVIPRPSLESLALPF